MIRSGQTSKQGQAVSTFRAGGSRTNPFSRATRTARPEIFVHVESHEMIDSEHGEYNKRHQSSDVEHAKMTL